MSAIQAYEKTLGGVLIGGLQKIPDIKIYGITDKAKLNQRVPTISFTMAGLTPREVAKRLAGENIFVWDGHFYAVATIERLGLASQGGIVRVGLCHYNTPEEVEVLLGELSKMGRESARP